MTLAEFVNHIVPWLLGILTIGFISLIRFGFSIKSEIANVSKDVAVNTTDVQWLIRAMGNTAGRTLHSPHTPELDHLIEKFEREELLWPEVAKFATMLKTIETSPDAPKGDKLAAGILLMSLEKTYGIIAKNDEQKVDPLPVNG